MVDHGMLMRAYDAWNARDADALVELAHPDIEIEPLVAGVVSTGPWRGHAGVRALVQDAAQRWHRFHVRLDDFLEIDGRVLVFVRVETVVQPGSVEIKGDGVHVLVFEDGRVRRFAAYRGGEEALAAITEG